MTLLPLLESRNRFPSLLRRDRVNDLDEMMEMLFEHAPAFAANGLRLPIDIEEQDKEYIVSVNVPGIEKKDIEVTLQDRMLAIDVKQEQTEQEERKDFLRKERWLGRTSRSVTLPHAASQKDVDASLKDGVLRLIVKKEPTETTKKIAIH